MEVTHLHATCIADMSALARLGNAAVRAALSPLLLEGSVATCSVIDLELLYSARDHRNFLAIRAEQTGLERVDVLQDDFDRAVDVMGLLASTARHRAAGLPDLLIGAIAERASLTVVHYDADFDWIAGVTGQPVLWVVPRGSID